MVTTALPTNVQTLGERLDRYRTTLKKLNTEGADKRIIKSWEARIVKLDKELKAMATETTEDVDQNEEVAEMPAVKDKPKPTPALVSKKNQAKAKQAEVAKGKAKSTPAKSTTATPTKPKPAQTQTAPIKQTPKKSAPVTQKPAARAPTSRAEVKSLADQARAKQADKPSKPVKGKAQAPVTNTRGQTKGIPGKNNIVYPDLNKTDPTFGGRGTVHCMCGCKTINRRGGKFSSGHDNRFRMLLGRIERGEQSGEDIAASTLVDLKANKTLTVGGYTAKDIIKLSTRRLRKGRK